MEISSPPQPVLRFCILSIGILCLFTPGKASAQVIPDNSLPNPSSAPRTCTDCEITGGTRAGNNLFHSFQQFSIPTGGRAYFNNAPDIRNIFARVTGQSRSVIDGMLQANGTANLFLLNPNGILFSRNASLKLGGSFFATTAEQIKFADGNQFSVRTQAAPLLTISAPIGLQMSRNSGAVVNQAQLAVAANRTLGLVGNGVFLDNGSLVANSGRVELGSVAPSNLVALTVDNAGYSLGYANRNFGDIEITNRSLIDTSGISSSPITAERSGGAAQLQGRNIRVTAGSIIAAQTYEGRGAPQQFYATRTFVLNSASVAAPKKGQAAGRAGDIIVQANTLELGTGSDRSVLASQTFADSAGDAGNLVIQADRVAVQAGSRVETATFGSGRGGNLSIRARTVEVSGFYPRSRDFNNDSKLERRGQITSGISSQAERGANTGDAGNLMIRTERLIIQNGGVISTATFGSGKGGNLSITADQIHLVGTSPAATRSQYRSGIFVSAEPDATGRVGELNLNADRLSLDDRSQISARNRGSGQPGAATLTLRGLTVHGGSEISASTEQTGRGGTLTLNADRIQIAGTGEFRGTSIPSSLSALSTAKASGQAGDLRINTASLSVNHHGVISVSGEGSGAAGNLDIKAERILLNSGHLEASTQSGSGAEIRLQNLDLLLLQNQSVISARAFNNADGGNLNIQAPNGYLVAGLNQNNDIIANAKAGSGGEITVNTRGLIGLEQRLSNPPNATNDIDASSEQGAQGVVNIVQPNVDPSRGLIELPSTIVDAASLIDQTCPRGGTAARTNRLSKFVITGRGGLPPGPTDPRDDDALLSSWATLAEVQPEQTGSTRQNRQSQDPEIQPPDLVEAQGWIRNANGEIILTAQAPVPHLHSSTLFKAGCH
jgi:filamentous hemagglutinin family protein